MYPNNTNLNESMGFAVFNKAKSYDEKQCCDHHEPAYTLVYRLVYVVPIRGRGILPTHEADYSLKWNTQHDDVMICTQNMITSLHGNAFCIVGPLWGNRTHLPVKYDIWYFCYVYFKAKLMHSPFFGGLDWSNVKKRRSSGNTVKPLI